MARPQRHPNIPYVGRETFLITATTRNGIHAFADMAFGRLAMQRISEVSTKLGFSIPVFVYMLDHAHVVTVGERNDSDVRTFVAGWKQATGFDWHRAYGGPLWQPGFWDNHLREGTSIDSFIEYVVLNPVRAGLVAHPADYPLLGSTQFSIDE